MSFFLRRNHHHPSPGDAAQSSRNQWKSGTIIDCLDDLDVCVVTCCLPCLVYSENRSTLHGGPANSNDEGIDPCLIYCLIMTLSACTLQCLYAYSTRTDIRRKYDLEEDPCDDCLTHICCHLCALCQEHRELRMYPLTKWPLPASQDPTTSYQGQYVHRPHQAMSSPSSPVSYGPHSGYSLPPHMVQRFPGASSSNASVPFHYASYSGDMHHGYQMPYVPGYYQRNQYPASPPRPGPPQPLVYETHRYGGGIIPGIPAHVYQVPKFPDMSRGHARHPSDDHGSHRG